MKRTFLVLAGSALVLVFAAVADAGVQSKVWIAGTTLKIRDASTGAVANGDFDNGITVKAKRDEGVVYVLDYNGSLVVGPGCTAGSFTETTIWSVAAARTPSSARVATTGSRERAAPTVCRVAGTATASSPTR